VHSESLLEAGCYSAAHFHGFKLLMDLYEMRSPVVSHSVRAARLQVPHSAPSATVLGTRAARVCLRALLPFSMPLRCPAARGLRLTW
jgi:hypothetical protein